MAQKVKQLKAYPTIGVCGLDCGLCPRYYTVGKSRCPGCGGPGFLDKHPSCSFITCCVKKKGLEACGQCPEFPCPKFKSEEEYQPTESSSYPPARKMLSNLRFIKEKGIEEFAGRQRKRIDLLETMIDCYDDGRSRSFFCRAAALLDPEDLKASLQKAKKALAGSGTRDAAHRAKVVRVMLEEVAAGEGVELTPQRPSRPGALPVAAPTAVLSKITQTSPARPRRRTRCARTSRSRRRLSKKSRATPSS